MLIIDENLKQLMSANEICDIALYDQFSISIKLGESFYEPKRNVKKVIYNVEPKPTELFSEKKVIDDKLILEPGGSVIACSKDLYKIPLKYFGLVQTKGTLARLFIQATCNDGQVEPGFEGYITLEITNLSPWMVEIPKSSKIAQLFIYQCSTSVSEGYSGRYAVSSKNGPTLPIFQFD